MDRGNRRHTVVASVPAGHAYVRRLTDPDVLRPPDPDPDHPDDVARTAGSRWWPPVMLRPEWARRAEFDVAHVHFGFDDASPARLREWVEVLRARRKPLVFTAHDLRSPHQLDRSTLDAQLDVLVPAATRVVTLTDGAAAEIRRRWGREAVVVPHPHLVDLDVMGSLRGSRLARASAGGAGPARVGLSVKSLRANSDPERLLPALLGLPGVRTVVSVHRSLMQDPADERSRSLGVRLRAEAAAGRLELLVHEPMTDVELWEHVAGLDAVVLPYRFGTHSGWLEMAHDLGTSVVAPDLGHYRDQHPDALYAAGEDAVDLDSVRAAVVAAIARRADDGLPGLDAAERAAQVERVLVSHREIYTQALASVGTGRAGDAA